MKKVYHALCKAEVAVCAVGYMFLVAFIFVSAILRSFRLSMSWNIDLAMFLLAWTSFLGADIAWRSGQLVGIDIVTRRLPFILQKIVALLVYICIFAALIIIAFFGFRLMITERVRMYQSIPIPYSLMTLSLVVAALSMLLSTILKVKRCVLEIAGRNKGGVQ
ncbi:MAG: TRAP transporter small permease subunit [Spirochaetaceae bacterium]|jgi:TRAP-type C4-dicarboxylate transport system permease small subunit|nr:TRAP transporter small permease subunit [Spirochaetaceae bacterium]